MSWKSDDNQVRHVVVPALTALLHLFVASIVAYGMYKGYHRAKPYIDFGVDTAMYGAETAFMPVQAVYNTFVTIRNFFRGHDEQLKAAIQNAIENVPNATNTSAVGHGKKKKSSKVFGKQRSLKSRTIKSMLEELKKTAEGHSSRNSSIVEHPHAYEMPHYVYDYAEKMRR